MSFGVLGRRYAKAVLPLLVEKKMVQESLSALESVAGYFQPGVELFRTLLNPQVSKLDKAKVVENILNGAKAPLQLTQVYLLLLQATRVLVYPDFQIHLIAMLRAELKLYPAELVTAEPMDEEKTKYFVEQMSKKKSRQFLLTKKLDPEILGGLIFRDGFTEYDFSLATQLDLLKLQMLQDL